MIAEKMKDDGGIWGKTQLNKYITLCLFYVHAAH